MTLLLGYARVSTQDQNPALQADVPNGAGCYRVIIYKVSRATPWWCGNWTALADPETPDQSRLRPTVLGSELSLPAREHRHHQSQSKLIFHVSGALAGFERGMIRERTMAGLAAGPNSGPQGRLAASDDAGWPARMYDSKQTVAAIAKTIGVRRMSAHRHLGDQVGGHS